MTPIFELVHSWAPDIAGKNIANPIGQICSDAMMLNYLGEKSCRKYYSSDKKTLEKTENKTKDLKGTANTVQCADAVLNNI